MVDRVLVLQLRFSEDMECLKTWMFDKKTDDFHFSRHTAAKPAESSLHIKCRQTSPLELRDEAQLS